MFSVEDYHVKYKNQTDEEVIRMYYDIDNYTTEAQEALRIVIGDRGGYEKLLHQLERKTNYTEEKNRIIKETEDLFNQGVDISLIRTTASSTLLPVEEVHLLIDSTYKHIEATLEDKRIKPRTIIGSLLGGVIASILGGVFWGVQMIYSGRIFYIFLIGLALLAYGIIKLFTQQSKENKIVLIATVISVLLALLLGQFLYDVFGNRHP